ncbi:uncharacterized protein [Parasteatoda tepidariorum]|uniref:uncharacterized protein isoform X3 n=2 Tax=Parasteatoda tepidariorum TaxID=114398 RepID=UPI001C728C83|nr:uncharacterized protein LOC107451019 isoform X3 [Parasteatoda tepidariorum]
MWATFSRRMVFCFENNLPRESTEENNAASNGSRRAWTVATYFMAARRIIAGYLVLKPAGTLSRLKGRKRLWFVLDEGRCRLLYYKSEIDARSKDPLGAIEIRGSAISLALEEDNQFVVHSNGREHALVAEDHESMMLWILALQARQDKEIVEPSMEANGPSRKKKLQQTSSGDAQPNLQQQVAASVKSKVLQRTHSLQLNSEKRHDALKRMHSLWATTSKEPDIIQNGKAPPIKRPSIVKESQESSNDSSPVSPTIGAMGVATDSNNNDGGQPRPVVNLQEALSDLSSDTESCDDESESDIEDEPKNEHVRILRKMNSEGMAPQEITPLKDRASSLSGTSVSSDSAVGTSDYSASTRLQELETELMCTKCDLAKALNRESAYKSIIEEKILLVNELEERLRSAENPDGDAVWKSPVHKGSSGNFQEKCRILQNHNRFLNEEVLKLAKMMQQEKKNTEHKNQLVRHIEQEVDQLKRDYVFLMQSSLRINNTDGPETMDVYLYGGNRHKNRVLMLLEEARKINPTLPIFENMTRGLYHVDPLGFRRNFGDESLIIHYICRQLHQHYSSIGPQYEVHQQQWKKHLRQSPTLPNSKELKSLVRKGIPLHLRNRVWAILYRSRVNDIMESKGPHYYNFLCSLAPDDERVTNHKRQIALDLLRTMPDNIRFADSNADGVRKMQEVLQAFCVHNPNLGYCQGMNFLVGMCLLFMEPEDAFWCLVAVSERYFTANYFDQNLIGAQADQEVLKDLLREKMPLLWQHFSQLDIELCTVTLNWFLAIFFDCVPFETLLRIWDCFLLEGPKVLFRFSLAILKMNERSLLAKQDTVSIMRQLKSAAKLCFDVDHLFQTAFEDLKPFTRRQDIATKQACYYKTLKEHAKKMDLEKIALKDRERMFSELDFLSVNQFVIECAAVYDKDKLWLCHGHHSGAHITKVNCDENIMYRLNIELESRVMCMHAIDDDTMLLGTLSHFVHAYSTKSRRLLWEIRLNDSVLSLASHEEDGFRQVYAGLADGTVAVVESIEGQFPKPETFYIIIGSNPVTCLRHVDRRLWCGTGNRVVILNARTLDSVDQFHTSSSCLDYLSMLVSDDRGVWLTIRGSSVLQLWDPHTLTCKLLFDVKDNKYPRSPKTGEEEIGGSRITALLPLSGSVIVGTAEGSLIIYDVVTKLSRSPSTAEFGSTPSNRRQPVADHIQQKIQLLMEKKREDNSDGRHRVDSGCYTTPRRSSLLIPLNNECQNSPENAAVELSQEVQEEAELECSSPEDQSEATSHSTVKRADTAERASLTSPESQSYEEQNEDNLKKIDTDRDDSGHSSAPGKIIDTTTKRLCTCTHSGSNTVKCRHCLLEASEALRKLFDKYSLSINSTNHVDYNTRYQNLLNSTQNRTISLEKNLKKDESRVKTNDSQSERKSAEDSWSDSSVELPPNCNGENEVKRSSRGSHQSTDSQKSEIPNISQQIKNNALLRAISADDVTQWVKSQETLTSSLASDSYDFDDVFVSYTEDESSARNKIFRETDGILESIKVRALTQRRSSNVLEYSGTSSALSQRTDLWLSDAKSSWFDTASTSSAGFSFSRLKDVRTQLPTWGTVTSENEASEAPLNSFSYEDSVTDSSVSGTRDILQLGDWSTHKSSETASNVSFSSTEVPYAFELNLQEKIKISDKPIKCLLETRCGTEPTIISCAGCYGDDEAVLKWTKVGNEELWTNDPIIEVCPYTNAIKPSPYARSRLPRRTSSLMSVNTESESTARASLTSTSSSTSSVVGSGLAKVHNIFLRVHDKA